MSVSPIPQDTSSRFNEDIIDFLENSPVALHWIDSDGYIKWANKAELQMLGYTEDEYLGQHITQFHNDPELIVDVFQRLKSGEILNGYETTLKCKDGIMKPVFVYCNVYQKNGKFVHSRCITIDASIQTNLNSRLEREVKERTQDLQSKISELEKSEERYHKMIEEVVDYAIVLLDQDGIIQNWNKGAEKIKGYKEEEIIGRSFKEFYLERDREKKLPEKLIDEARNNGKAIHEGWRLRKDGSYFWGSIVITALHDAENNIVGFSKVTRDLTERKTAEDKMIEYTNQLEFQNNELQQFAFAASHDMKEPLRKISFYNDYITQNNADSLDAKSREYLHRSMLAVKRMSKLIDDLLTYSKTQSPNDNYEFTDLYAITEDIIASHNDIIDQDKVIFELNKMPQVYAIPFQLKQLLDNLINNAIKYRHPDRQSIIKINGQWIKGVEINDIGVDKRLTYYHLSVSDNGIGFDAKFADKIFEIFQRLSNKSDYKGSGIGLAICKKIVLNHHGFIKATGRENEGATFDVYISDNNS